MRFRVCLFVEWNVCHSKAKGSTSFFRPSDEVGTALWSDVRVVVVGEPPPPTQARNSPPLRRPDPPCSSLAEHSHVTVSRDGWLGALAFTLMKRTCLTCQKQNSVWPVYNVLYTCTFRAGGSGLKQVSLRSRSFSHVKNCSCTEPGGFKLRRLRYLHEKNSDG